MAHRHVGAATSLCHIPLRPSLCCISLLYLSAVSLCRILPPHHAPAARRAFLLAAGGTGHAPSGPRAACRTPAGAGCASLLHWLRAGKLGHARIRLLRLSGCRINLRSRLASPARFNLHGHSSRLALPLSFVPWPRKHPPVWRVCGMRLLLGFATHCHGAARLPCLPRAACHRQLCPAFFAPTLRGHKQATRAQSRRRCTPLASILACAD